MFSMRPAKEGVEYKTRQKKGSVSLSTIDKICGYLKCQPCDIMELGE
jgi:DNA-binding Xre family transcriptional regulator